MKYKNDTQNKKSKTPLYLLLFIGLLVGLLIILEISGTTNFYSRGEPSSETTVQPVNTVNYDPPTEEEKKASDEKKQEIVDSDNQQTDKPSTAEVIITDASQYEDEIEVRAFVANVIESGTCTYLFELNGEKISKPMPAAADASSTPCMTLTLPRSEFPSSGVWSITVSFESASVKGSKTQEITIE